MMGSLVVIRKQWRYLKVAMKEEMDALEKNKTWDLVELSKERKVVGCKWVYKLKKSVVDKVERYKARLVAKGYFQKEGIDFHEVFSPIVCFNSCCVSTSCFT
jgi:hypothetical protein